MTKIKTRCRHPQLEIYTLILRGEPYTDILDNVLSERRRTEIVSKIEKFRTIESREMTVGHRVQVTGLPRRTCEEFSKVYTQIVKYGAT